MNKKSSWLVIGCSMLTGAGLTLLILMYFFHDTDSAWLSPLDKSKTWKLQNNVIDCGEFIGITPPQLMCMFDVRRQFGEPRKVLNTSKSSPDRNGKIYYQVNIYHNIAFVECSAAEMDTVVLILIRQPGREGNLK